MFMWFYGVADKCSDGLKSPGETGVDCGGVCVSSGKLCPVGSGCTNDTDCSGATCGVNDTCAGEYFLFSAEKGSQILVCCSLPMFRWFEKCRGNGCRLWRCVRVDRQIVFGWI
jgi:hypothetical protein